MQINWWPFALRSSLLLFNSSQRFFFPVGPTTFFFRIVSQPTIHLLRQALFCERLAFYLSIRHHHKICVRVTNERPSHNFSSLNILCGLLSINSSIYVASAITQIHVHTQRERDGGEMKVTRAKVKRGIGEKKMKYIN